MLEFNLKHGELEAGVSGTDGGGEGRTDPEGSSPIPRPPDRERREKEKS